MNKTIEVGCALNGIRPGNDVWIGTTGPNFRGRDETAEQQRDQRSCTQPRSSSQGIRPHVSPFEPPVKWKRFPTERSFVQKGW